MMKTMENIIISDNERLEELKKRIFEDGKEKFHVLSDFDRTLTKAFYKGEKMPSVIYELRRGDYISSEYAKKANALADKYHAIEIDPNVPLDEKKKAMHEWWTKHFELLINSGLKREHIKQVIDSGRIKFRENTGNFFDFLHEKNIPLVIMSSAGLGGDSIKMMLEKENRLYDNVHITSNEFEWDSDANAIGIKEPIIHMMNKSEASIQGLPIYSELLQRRNVLLLGDGLSDIDMIEGFDYNNLIKVGFLNYNVPENLENYKKAFDVLILNDGPMDYVNNLLKEIVEQK